MHPLSLFKHLKHDVRSAGLSLATPTAGPRPFLQITVSTFARQKSSLVLLLYENEVFQSAGTGPPTGEVNQVAVKI